eukprot:g1228.t1
MASLGLGLLQIKHMNLKGFVFKFGAEDVFPTLLPLLHASAFRNICTMKVAKDTLQDHERSWLKETAFANVRVPTRRKELCQL